MIPIETAVKLVTGVRRINDRWIVRGQLRQHAAAYLDHLEATDLDRLLRSCQFAMDVVKTRVSGEDPKPLFYAALFAFARLDEVERFLAEHRFTRTAWLHYHQQPDGPTPLPEDVLRLVDHVVHRMHHVAHG